MYKDYAYARKTSWDRVKNKTVDISVNCDRPGECSPEDCLR